MSRLFAHLPFRSISSRLTLAFWLVSISGILIIALLAGRVTRMEFDRYVRDAQYPEMVAALEAYYAVHGSWEGVSALLDEFHQQDVKELEAEKSGKDFFMLANHRGEILAPAQNGQAVVVKITAERLGHSIPLQYNRRLVGYLVPSWQFKTPPAPINPNIERVNIYLFAGAVAATLLALLLGWTMARNITQPLKALNAATQAVAQGNLDKQINIQNKDEIGDLAASFNAMSASLKKSRDQRRQMTADIAHELRTPLSLILGHSEAIADGVLPATPETLEIIQDEARQLARLVDDLRTLSLSDAGELSLMLSPLPPARLLADLVEAYQGQAQRQNITLLNEISPGLPELQADRDRIGQALRNLLENAFRFTPAGGQITVSAHPGQDRAGGVTFCIADTGPGISAADLPNIFERFYRGDKSRSRQDGGSGLGLAIARSLVELHQGKIWAESQPGQGAAFFIWLPVARQDRGYPASKAINL